MLTGKAPFIAQYLAEELIVSTGWDAIDAAEVEQATVGMDSNHTVLQTLPRMYDIILPNSDVTKKY